MQFNKSEFEKKENNVFQIIEEELNEESINGQTTKSQAQLHDLSLKDIQTKKTINKKKVFLLVLFFSIVFIFASSVIKFATGFFQEQNNNDNFLQQTAAQTPQEIAMEKEIEQTFRQTQDENITEYNVTKITPEQPAQQSQKQSEQPVAQKQIKQVSIDKPAQQEQQTQKAVQTIQKPVAKQAAATKEIKQEIATQKQSTTKSVVVAKSTPEKTKKETLQTTNAQPLNKSQEQQKPQAKQNKVQKEKNLENLFDTPQPKQTKESKEPKPTQQTKIAIAQSTQYIQVGAFSKLPSEDFFAKIKAKGFNYNVTTTTKNGTSIQKVTIGPIDTKTIHSDLAKVKKDIAPNAFIVK